MSRLRNFVYGLILLLLAGPLAAATLEEATNVARAGATQLALQMMDAAQPPFAAQPEEWLAWEQARLRVYELHDDWQALADRLAILPDGVPPVFRQEALTRRAQALLELGEPAAARAVLTDLLWSDAPARTHLPRWRRMVIRSYLAEDNFTDAQTAIQYYQQDYPDEAADWRRLQARLNLRTGQAAQARTVLQADTSPEASALRLLADLRAAASPPSEIFEAAVRLAVEKQTPPGAQYLAWSVAAEAAAVLGNWPARISALERALLLPPPVPANEQVLHITADVVWNAYLRFGEQLGNELHLIVGDDQAWFMAASNRYDKQPIHARALFAVVAFNALQVEQRAVAHAQFGALLREQAHGDALLYALYLQSEKFATPVDVPAAVRYLLIDHVLGLPDVQLASQLLIGLDTPPPGVAAGEWQLRRARVLLLGGDIDAGVAALDSLFVHGNLPPLDRVLQVLFDLQTLSRHEDALRFFTYILGSDISDQQRREVLYWTADSWKGMGEDLQAARFYLQSATLLDPVGMDPWAQTARYQAAEALARGGLYNDAMRLYTGLLNSTRDPARQAVLRRELQQLQLRVAQQPE